MHKLSRVLLVWLMTKWVLASGPVHLELIPATIPPLPGYPQFLIENEIEGTMTVLVDFDDAGNVGAVELRESELRGDWKSEWGSLEESLFELISECLKEWSTLAHPEGKSQIRFKWILDDGLEPRQRSFSLVFSRYGFIEEVEVKAPRNSLRNR
ncbi:MAG: hypothetical protein Kow00109_15890 [Acidobacteriota bacterium]